MAHRGDYLAKKLLGQLPGRTVQPVNYEALKQRVKQGGERSKRQLAKFRDTKAQHAADDEARLTQFHKEVWMEHQAQLQKQRVSVEREVEALFNDLSEHSSDPDVLAILVAYFELEEDASDERLLLIDATHKATRATRRFERQLARHQKAASAASAALTSSTRRLHGSRGSSGSVSSKVAQGTMRVKVEYDTRDKAEFVEARDTRCHVNEELSDLHDQEQDLMAWLMQHNAVFGDRLRLPPQLSISRATRQQSCGWGTQGFHYDQDLGPRSAISTPSITTSPTVRATTAHSTSSGHCYGEDDFSEGEGEGEGEGKGKSACLQNRRGASAPSRMFTQHTLSTPIKSMTVGEVEGEGDPLLVDQDSEDLNEDDDETLLAQLGFSSNFSEWQADFATLVESPALDDSDSGLVETLWAEFNNITSACRQRVFRLIDTYAPVIFEPYGGWDHNSHALFSVTYAAYTRVKGTDILKKLHKTKRQACFHRLQRIFPEISRKRLTQHEQWLTSFSHFLEVSKAIAHTNARVMTAFLNSIRGIILTYLQEKETAKSALLEKAREQERQVKLMERLLALRHRRMLQLQEDMQKEMEKEEVERFLQAKRQEEQRAARQRARAAIKKYHAAQEKESADRVKAIEAARARQALENAKQQKVNARRVQYRDEQIRAKQLAADKAREEAKQSEFERQQRLESLRQQVRPTNVEADPVRLLQPTAAHLAAIQDSKAQRKVRQALPLFSAPSFNDRQITSDKRFKLAAALSKAGLQGTDYARRAMIQMQSTRPARRDMQSTAFQPPST
eukprot:m.48620 g.48620  ORF g.48620 m.48620 type:complete len:791 (+) comp11051_c1_seq4:143-2515(+)